MSISQEQIDKIVTDFLADNTNPAIAEFDADEQGRAALEQIAIASSQETLYNMVNIAIDHCDPHVVAGLLVRFKDWSQTGPDKLHIYLRTNVLRTVDPISYNQLAGCKA